MLLLKDVLLDLGLSKFSEHSSRLQKYAQGKEMLGLEEYKSSLTKRMKELLEAKE